MVLQSYEISHCHCLNIFLLILLIGNQRYQVPLFRYINQEDEVSHLVRLIRVPAQDGLFALILWYVVKSILISYE